MKDLNFAKKTVRYCTEKGQFKNVRKHLMQWLSGLGTIPDDDLKPRHKVLLIKRYHHSSISNIVNEKLLNFFD